MTINGLYAEYTESSSNYLAVYRYRSSSPGSVQLIAAVRFNIDLSLINLRLYTGPDPMLGVGGIAGDRKGG
jgi:hypothetical protein